LAKEASTTSSIIWSPSDAYKIQSTPIWNGLIIDIAPRNFIKEINKLITIKEWTNQNRIHDLFGTQIQDFNNYGWRQFWNNLKKNNNSTSFKDNHKRSFLIKLMHNELPTLDRLAIRKPELYGNLKKCVICLEEEENREHLFQCKGLAKSIIQIWQDIMEDLKNEIRLLLNKKSQDKENHGLSRTTNNKIQNQAQSQDKVIEEITKLLEQKILKSQTSLLNFTLGLLDNNLIKKIISILDRRRTTTTKIKTLLIQTSNKFRNQFRKKVWNNRCKIVVETDHTRGITLRHKKRIGKKSIERRFQKERRKDLNQRKTIEEATERNKPIKTVKNEIHDWIKYGSKWLGIN